jgi:cytochrome c-type biogenesis protein CcmH
MAHGRIRSVTLTFLLAVLTCGAPRAFAVDPTQLPDPELQSRYSDLTHELRCVQCQNQSIADSPVGLASDLRREVRDMLLAGKTDAEIRDFMVARYGDFILFRPRLAPRTLWLWATPLVLLALGAWVAVRVVRERAALAPTDDSLPDDAGEGGVR